MGIVVIPSIGIEKKILQNTRKKRKENYYVGKTFSKQEKEKKELFVIQ